MAKEFSVGTTSSVVASGVKSAKSAGRNLVRRPPHPRRPKPSKVVAGIKGNQSGANRNTDVATFMASADPLPPYQLRSGWRRAREMAGQLEVGDLIELKRFLPTSVPYVHWVVYLGLIEGIQCVAHISTEDGDLGCTTKKELVSKLAHGARAVVRSDPFFSIAGEDACRINNQLDASHRPFPPVIIVERALLRLGSGNYNLLWNNCEHFAKWCRYGTSQSDQAAWVQSGLLGMGALAVTGSVPVALGVGTAGYVVLRVGRAIGSSRLFPRAII